MLNAKLAHEHATSYKNTYENSKLSDQEKLTQSRLLVIGSLISSKVAQGDFELRYPKSKIDSDVGEIKAALIELGYDCTERTRLHMSLNGALETYLHIQW